MSGIVNHPGPGYDSPYAKSDTPYTDAIRKWEVELDRQRKLNEFKLVEKMLEQEIEKDPLTGQVGGSHYIECAIQPGEYIEANKMLFFEGCVVKRVTRHDKPTGKGREDIEKAIHELQLILKFRYDKKTEA
jgi:hypothetical protein